MVVLGLIIIVIGIVIAVCIYNGDYTKNVIITLLATVAISTPLIIIGIKPNISNDSDETNCTVIITAEDGRIIYEYEGAVDIEINSTYRKLKFKDENGKRQTIIFGMQDTAQIIGQ